MALFRDFVYRLNILTHFWLYKNLQLNNNKVFSAQTRPKFNHLSITRRLIGPNQQSGVGNSYDIGFSP